MTRKIEPGMLKALLRYDAKTGELYWLARSREFFETQRAYQTWNKRFPGRPALNYIGVHGYKVGMMFGSCVKAHRVIWALVYGEWPDHIDHIDGDTTNNRIDNLRNVSRAENARNHAQHRKSTHYAMGVDTRNGGRTWRARKAGLHIGVFSTKEAAIAAIKKAEADLGFHPNHGREIRRPA